MTGVLGFGAMGQVYRAEHDLMGRKAAIKVLNKELSENEEVVQRFLNEARAVNDIRHPHVVEITDFGMSGNQYYLIMELLEGETLTDYMAQCGALPPAEAVRVSVQIASALEAAHNRGIVHRDLKPDNVFLLERGAYALYVKLLDFGVAKLVGPARSAQQRRTQLGTLIGTPHYMSPEQCLGELEVGAPSDVYSLGVMLYEMLTGELPFERESLSELLRAHIHEPPTPVQSKVPDLPEFLVAAVTRALQKQPKARHGSMGELRRALLRDPRFAAPPDALGRSQPKLPAWQVGAAQAAQELPESAGFARAPTMAFKRRAPEATLDTDEASTPNDGDAERPQRVGNRLAGIIRERVQSQNLVLPTMPHVAVQCSLLLGDERTTFAHMAKLLERDPLIAAQVMKVANSVAFVSLEKVRTLDQAVGRLGARQLRALLVELSARKAFRSRERRIREAFHGIWKHSLVVAATCRGLCRLLQSSPDAEVAYLAGLLHDLGKPTVGSMLLEAERRLSANEQHFMTPSLWMQVVQDTHRDVGKAIVRSWKMPDEVADAVGGCGHYAEGREHQIRNVVTLANGLAKQAGYCLNSALLEGNDAVVELGLTTLRLEKPLVVQLMGTIMGQLEQDVPAGTSHAVA